MFKDKFMQFITIPCIVYYLVEMKNEQFVTLKTVPLIYLKVMNHTDSISDHC